MVCEIQLFFIHLRKDFGLVMAYGITELGQFWNIVEIFLTP